jgi:hypothetical protein
MHDMQATAATAGLRATGSSSRRQCSCRCYSRQYTTAAAAAAATAPCAHPAAKLQTGAGFCLLAREWRMTTGKNEASRYAQHRCTLGPVIWSLLETCCLSASETCGSVCQRPNCSQLVLYQYNCAVTSHHPRSCIYAYGRLPMHLCLWTSSYASVPMDVFLRSPGNMKKQACCSPNKLRSSRMLHTHNARICPAPGCQLCSHCHSLLCTGPSSGSTI